MTNILDQIEPNINKTPEQENNSLGAFFWDLAKIFVLALIIIVPFRIFIAEPFVVSGSSMLPNFYNKDYLIIDRLSYRLNQPQRGDIIVFKYPKKTSEYFIKRVIGLPGESVRVYQGGVTIFNKTNPQGFRLTETYLPENLQTLGKSDKITLGTDEYYVLGDNRMSSSDSRIWGILPRDDIIGKVFVRVWPFKRFGKI